jgi:hypothetical protein
VPSLLSRRRHRGSGAYVDDAERALKLGAGAGAGTLDAWTLPSPARRMFADPTQNGALSLRGTNDAGGLFFGSNRRIDQLDVGDVIDSLRAQGATHITVLSGTHGGFDGEIFTILPTSPPTHTKELTFLIEDLKHAGVDVTVLNVNMVTRSELEKLTGHVYGAWCWSNESELWIDILGP